MNKMHPVRIYQQSSSFLPMLKVYITIVTVLTPLRVLMAHTMFIAPISYYANFKYSMNVEYQIYFQCCCIHNSLISSIF